MEIPVKVRESLMTLASDAAVMAPFLPQCEGTESIFAPHGQVELAQQLAKGLARGVMEDCSMPSYYFDLYFRQFLVDCGLSRWEETSVAQGSRLYATYWTLFMVAGEL